ncbi:MAG: DRTGG domain-containing protein [Bacteroidales bacterium]|jgi:serine kinase of HPr protein (carbohydrate metabolism regulator)|nr:DRTGG domain-containing protein [Bacteroidales bacterium]
MTIKEIAKELNLNVFCGREGLENKVTGGYVSDLLSDVMGNSEAGQAWITLQSHRNVAAIASLRELSGIILVKNNEPDEAMAKQAEEEGIPVLGTPLSAYEITGKLFQLLQG